MGVEIEVTSPGNGKDFPKNGDTVTLHYVGRFLDGKTFDSSIDRGSPFVTKLGFGKVVKGWEVGVPKMSLGEKATLKITGDYGYGERGFPNLIPANATLVFDVELLKINDKEAAEDKALQK